MSTLRRLDQLNNILSFSSESEEKTLISIGDIKKYLKVASAPELIPYLNNELFFAESQEVLSLHQDVFLIGPPTNFKRRLVLKYAQLTNREVEYLTITKDTTDADLKQRREIVNNTSIYTDSVCVRAALMGRILVLDGLEKAERNVLPILNNLLENREMSLEDGRFLCSPFRYENLVSKKTIGLRESKLCKVSENFFVIALGCPVPKYEGYHLDPPLRSRFQARNIPEPSFDTQIQFLKQLSPSIPLRLVERVLSIKFLFNSKDSFSSNESVVDDGAVKIPEFNGNLEVLLKLLEKFPNLNVRVLLESCYPFAELNDVLEQEQIDLIEAGYSRFDFIKCEKLKNSIGYGFNYMERYKNTENNLNLASISFKDLIKLNIVKLVVNAGSHPSQKFQNFVTTEFHQKILNTMFFLHSVTDFCLIGPPGVGKSAIVRLFSRKLGYNVETIPMYRDLSSRDLLQRRGTSGVGDTSWEYSPLVKAAIEGSIAVLDGIEVLSFGTISILKTLILERFCFLPDGSLLLSSDRYNDLNESENFETMDTTSFSRPKKILPIHPNFRIIALARPLSSVTVKKGLWLSPEVNSMFSFIYVRPLSFKEENQVLREFTKVPEDNRYVELLLKFALFIRSSNSSESKDIARELSTRQLTRICKRLQSFGGYSDLHSEILKACLFQFLPLQTKNFLKKSLDENLIFCKKIINENKGLKIEILHVSEKESYLKIGNVQLRIRNNTNPLLVPEVIFHENERQTIVLMEMLKDFSLGEHLAPTHVTSILKSLVEDGEMVLSDGRRIVTKEIDAFGDPKDYIFMHPDFRMFVLANRPGFPFLGNDFYAEIGDVFACHCIDNPDPDSEMALLLKYAPTVDKELLQKLLNSFNDLRRLVDEGLINYPYSTRELVSIVKHIETFPNEGLSRSIQNVFDFDQYDLDTKKLLFEVLTKNGIPVGGEKDFVVNVGMEVFLDSPKLLETWSSLRGHKILVHDIKTFDLHIKEGWKLVFSKVFNLDIVLGRVKSYTELLYSFKIPTNILKNGEAADSIILSNGEVLILTINPVTLYRIDASFRHATPIDLYEYFPMQKISFKFKLVELEPLKIFICNEKDNKIVIIDLKSNVSKICFIENITSNSLIRVCDSLKSYGILVFYQQGLNSIYVLDLKNQFQHIINLSIKINALHTVTKNNWIIQQYDNTFDTFKNFTLSSPDNIGIPNVLEEIKINSSVSSNAFELGSICSFPSDKFGYKNSQRFIDLPSFECYSALLCGFPGKLSESHLENIEIRAWPRSKGEEIRNSYLNIENSFLHLTKSQLYVTATPGIDGRNMGFLEFFDINKNSLRKIKVPLAMPAKATLKKDANLTNATQFQKKKNEKKLILKLIELDDGNLLTIDLKGTCRVWQVEYEKILTDLITWKKLTGGIDNESLSIIYNNGIVFDNDLNSTEKNVAVYVSELDKNGIGEGSGSGSGKGSGEGSGSGESEGGNEGAAGGSGGTGGPGSAEPSLEGRKSGTIDVSNFKFRLPGEIPKEITEARRDLHDLAMKKRLQQLGMTGRDMETFQKYHQNVKREITELRRILETVEAKNKERVWLRNQSTGDLDDSKL
ncbi:von Willebrand factor A domain-containing protein 8 [Clydaea vesicula]|uniref:von Willebrand factor A domain-containing protein 8 n=1 Tax=Clydaea vesicula TaxID=447962 RepID=A0AAD5U5F9_9FUNG|nr:von Willebrand factor A domain-containing protein 8 [Clydaea vesicula]